MVTKKPQYPERFKTIVLCEDVDGYSLQELLRLAEKRDVSADKVVLEVVECGDGYYYKSVYFAIRATYTKENKNFEQELKEHEQQEKQIKLEEERKQYEKLRKKFEKKEKHHQINLV